MKPDHTFDETCAFGSDRWCAHVLGYPLVTFQKARPQLEADGFPRPDGLIGRTNKADVHAWIARRRRLTDAVVAATHAADQPRVHHDRF